MGFKCDGNTKVRDHDATVQTKNRTKILIDNLSPKRPNHEIERLVTLKYWKAKAEEEAGYNLILDRARAEPRYFLMTIEGNPKQTTQSKAHLSPTVVS